MDGRTIAMITLDEATHTYTDDNGLIVPSVTQIIDNLTDYVGIPAHVLDHKSQIGIAVHKACELADKFILEWSSVSECIFPYLIAWQKFLVDTGFEVILNEHFVYHKRYRYAGMLDRVGILNDSLAVVDIKATAVIGPHVGIQLAGYQEAENSQRKKADKIKNRFAVQLKPDESYRLIPFEDKADYSVFLSQLTIFNWRIRYGKLISESYRAA